MTRFEYKPMSIEKAESQEKEFLQQGLKLNKNAKSEWDLKFDEFMRFTTCKGIDLEYENLIGFHVFLR